LPQIGLNGEAGAIHFTRDECFTRDEWTVARRYMSLEILARVNDKPKVRLPAVASRSEQGLSEGRRSCTTPRDTVNDTLCDVAVQGIAPTGAAKCTADFMPLCLRMDDLLNHFRNLPALPTALLAASGRKKLALIYFLTCV
jgi:hypothetical protein